MKVEETQPVPTPVTQDIICDSCGKSCANPMGMRAFEYMELKAHWGYGSGKDTETWTAHLCEQCVDAKLAFINFNKENYLK